MKQKPKWSNTSRPSSTVLIFISDKSMRTFRSLQGRRLTSSIIVGAACISRLTVIFGWESSFTASSISRGASSSFTSMRGDADNIFGSNYAGMIVVSAPVSSRTIASAERMRTLRLYRSNPVVATSLPLTLFRRLSLRS